MIPRDGNECKAMANEPSYFLFHMYLVSHQIRGAVRGTTMHLDYDGHIHRVELVQHDFGRSMELKHITVTKGKVEHEYVTEQVYRRASLTMVWGLQIFPVLLPASGARAKEALATRKPTRAKNGEFMLVCK